ncbi:protocadherin-23-like [Mytilus californianus]|uniref:protocadherin-23-like n=1 Tax=Mytilus californianus TaxID=6549 RepID=UPI0022457675|nr:protocadherin-23-like [Mytilus californianus]
MCFEITEKEGAGTSFGTPKYNVTDQDGDSVTFGLDCPTLNINTSTGEVTLSVNYDRDVVYVASSVTCDLTVTDGTMTSTATLQVIIYAINDNTPQFSQNSYEFHVSPYGTVGTIVGTVTASDADIGSHGIVSYLVESGTYSNYFGVDTSGNLYLRAAFKTVSGSTVSVSVRAYDEDNKMDTVTVDFIIQATTTMTTTTTTDRYLTFFGSPANVAWFSALMVILSELIVFLFLEVIRSTSILKLCSTCNDCEIPERRNYDNEYDFEDDEDYDYAPRHRGQGRKPIHKAAVHQWSAWKNKHEMNVDRTAVVNSTVEWSAWNQKSDT